MTFLNKFIFWVLLLNIMLFPSLYALTINLSPDANMAANLDAMAAFQRAAAQWQNWLTDPITVTINVGMQDLGSSTIIGQSGAVHLNTTYNNLASAVYNDSTNEIDDAIVGYLPTSMSFNMPTGFTYNGYLFATKANLKALGYTGLDESFGVADASITFNTQFAFDYDNRDGVNGMDFESVAVHEIAHALGFVSVVDEIDYYIKQGQSGSIYAGVLDLFRFNASNAPTTTATFTTNARELRPGVDAVFSDLSNQYAMSTGQFTGDGRQASHWKDDYYTGSWIGIMDPNISYGQIYNIQAADLRALDLIGYEVAIPEASSYLLFLLGILGFRILRKKR